MPVFVRNNGLALGFGLLFLVTLAFEAVSGHDQVNHDQLLHHGDPISLSYYVTSALFWADVMENWQSEYLQFSLYIFATIYLIQKGSNESKPPSRIGRESDEQQQLGEHAGRGAPRWARVGSAVVPSGPPGPSAYRRQAASTNSRTRCSETGLCRKRCTEPSVIWAATAAWSSEPPATMSTMSGNCACSRAASCPVGVASAATSRTTTPV